MKTDFIIKDYEQVRSELRYYAKNQFSLLITLLTLSVAIYEYSLNCNNPDNMIVLASGFVIPVMFAFVGVLWINQVYRQKELAYYSLLLERSIAYGGCNYNGWETFIHTKHSSFLERIKDCTSHSQSTHTCTIERIKKLDFSFFQIILSANHYYYGLVLLGFIVTPAAFSYYCTRQIRVLDINGVEYSSLCCLRWWITIIFYIILLFYVFNIFRVQYDISKEMKKTLTADMEL